jgi:hypothetical protein
MGAAVVLGQGLADGARPVRDRVVEDLAARDRQAGDRHGETAGKRRLAHLLPSCHPIRGDLARALCHAAAPPDTPVTIHHGPTITCRLTEVLS